MSQCAERPQAPRAQENRETASRALGSQAPRHGPRGVSGPHHADLHLGGSQGRACGPSACWELWGQGSALECPGAEYPVYPVPLGRGSAAATAFPLRDLGRVSISLSHRAPDSVVSNLEIHVESVSGPLALSSEAEAAPLARAGLSDELAAPAPELTLLLFVRTWRVQTRLIEMRMRFPLDSGRADRRRTSVWHTVGFITLFIRANLGSRSKAH